MIASYRHEEIQFQYPDNWSLAENETEGWPRSIMVESPDTAFWLLVVYPPGQGNLDELIDDVIRTMQAEWGEVDIERIDGELAGQTMVGFDMGFFEPQRNILVHSQTWWFVRNEQVHLVQYQAEDREFDEVLPVFEALTTSLLRTAGREN